jgi:hypothetical protein
MTWLGRAEPGQVGSGFGFLVIIFGLDRVVLGYSLIPSENFDPCPTRHMVGRVVFFGTLDWVSHVGQPTINSSSRR